MPALGTSGDARAAIGPAFEPQPPLSEQLLTWANLATTARLVGGFVAFGIALAEHSERWLYIGLAIYWSLDILDGLLARAFDQETLFGAQYDILVDRIQVVYFYLIFTAMHPEKFIAVTLFLVEFMVADHFLSNQFIRWKIRSPNYFYAVDKKIFDLLWSKLGKAANTGLVTLLIIFSPTVLLPIGVTLVLIAIRCYCAARVMTLPTPRLPPMPCERAE